MRGDLPGREKGGETHFNPGSGENNEDVIETKEETNCDNQEERDRENIKI